MSKRKATPGGPRPNKRIKVDEEYRGLGQFLASDPLVHELPHHLNAMDWICLARVTKATWAALGPKIHTNAYSPNDWLNVLALVMGDPTDERAHMLLIESWGVIRKVIFPETVMIEAAEGIFWTGVENGRDAQLLHRFVRTFGDALKDHLWGMSEKEHAATIGRRLVQMNVASGCQYLSVLYHLGKSVVCYVYTAVFLIKTYQPMMESTLRFILSRRPNRVLLQLLYD